MTTMNPTTDQLSEWMAQYYPPQMPQQPSRRLSDLALSPDEQQALMADLQQTQDPENAAIMQQMQQQPMQQPMPAAMPENYLQRTGGEVVPLQSIQQQGGMSLNDLLNKTGARIQDKVIMSDRGEGYRTPYGSVAGLDSQGRMWEVDKPQKPTVTVKQMKEYWDMMKAQKEATVDPAAAQIPKMKPGERWNPQQQRVESVPGSDVYITQSGKHSKDYEAMKALTQKTDFSIDRVNELLDPKNKALIERNFGGYNAYISQFLPGAGIEGKNKIEALKDTLKNAGLEVMRSGGSIGQMTEREWPIVERMIANITPSMSEKDAINELKKVSTFMKNIKDRGADVYQTEWGNTQFHKQQGQSGGQVPQLGSVVKGYVYLGGDPASQSSWKKAQ